MSDELSQHLRVVSRTELSILRALSLFSKHESGRFEFEIVIPLAFSPLTTKRNLLELNHAIQAGHNSS